MTLLKFRELAFYPAPAILMLAILIHEKVRAFEIYYTHLDGVRAFVVLALMLALVFALFCKITGRVSKVGLYFIFGSLAFLIYNSQSIAAIIFGSVILILHLIEKSFETKKVFQFLTVFSGLYLLMQMATHYISDSQVRTAPIRTGELPENVQLTSKPNIIHFMLDGYGSGKVLNTYYQHDNAGFIRSLENKGFSVIDPAFTPFDSTFSVMASVMNGGYVDMAEPDDTGDSYRRSVAKALADNSVTKIFEQNGYEIVATPTGLRYLGINNADYLYPKPFWHLTDLEEALLFPFWQKRMAKRHHKSIHQIIDTPIIKVKGGPYFYYQHLLSPHPPFVIDRNGDLRDAPFGDIRDGNHFTQNDPEKLANYISGYREKVMFTEAAILEQIGELSADPVVIIVHGDHGPRGMWQERNGPAYCPSERNQTFLAVYSNIPAIQQEFSNADKHHFNIVNIYRMILNGITGENIAPLESESHSISYADPRNHQAITNEEFSETCFIPDFSGK